MSVAWICSALGHIPVALLHIVGLCWSLAFLGFVVSYWRRVLTEAKLGSKADPAGRPA